MAVLMLVSCWVFVAPTDANAIMDDSSKKADKYGTPIWTANDNNTRWMRWGSAADSSNDHLYIKVPKTIYMDVSETLQSAGYVITYSWHFGDSTSYRIGISSPVWGENSSYTGQDSTYFYTMTNAFNDFTADASMHGSNAYGVNGYSNANQYDIRVFDTYSGYKSIGLKNLKGTFYSGTIYYVGTPKGTYSGRYSTYGSNPSYFGYGQKWSVTKWNEHSSYTNMMKGKPTAASEQHSGYNEVFWDVEIYDKGALKSAADNADTVYTNNYSLYNTYVLNDGLTALKKLADEGRNMLTVREQTKATVENKTSAINTAANGLEFQAKNAELKTKVAEAQTYLDRIKLYTDASTSALQNAINAAKNSTLYTNPAVYKISQYSDAGARAAADQASIATLIKNIDDAKNALVRKYDIGYDNLFSLTDWALNPVKNGKLGSNGTIEINADNGTIKITHDGSADGTDNNTSQQPTYYRAQVKGNTEYVLTWDTEGAGRAQIHVFYTTGDQYTYNVNSNYNSGSHWFVSNGDLPYSSDMGHHEVVFTTLPEADGLVFRFGTCNAGDSVTFSNIRLVEKSVYDAYAKNYNTVREAFAVGDTKNLSLTPAREGYVFDGWFKADGTKVTSVSGLTASDIVYARWSQNFTVTFKNEDGTVLKTEKVAPGAAATAPSNPTKAATKETEYAFNGWDKDFSNVQSDLTVTATYKNKAHTFVKSYLTGSTCTAAATYTQYCSTCSVSWGEEVFTDATMPALGHTYDRANPTSTVVTGTSTGKTDDHEHTIKCNECDATKTVKHNFQEDKSNPAVTATCTVKGETYYKCACLETKTVTGTTNPENHVHTEKRDAKDAACEVAGYTGDTWCTDCNTKIATGKATDALEHVYTTYTSNGDATCFADGTESALCDLCKDETKKDTRTEEGSKLTHKYTNYKYNEGTAKCEVNGTETASCDHGCGTEVTREAANSALKHDYTGAYKNNGDGTHSFLCKNGCGNYGGTVSCADTYGAWTTDNASTHSHTCTVCGYTPKAEDHIWSDWTKLDTNNDTSAGSMKRNCTVCGREETTECAYDSVVTSATCETDAYTTYTCKDKNCGHAYTVWDKGSATGHNFNGAYTYDEINDKHQQNCTNDNCSAKGVDTAKDEWADCSWSYANAGEGKHTATCVCKNSEEQNCSGGEATCTAQAVCQFCETAYGEKADHSYTGNTYFDGVVKAKDATCTAQAEYYTYCEFCKATSKGTAEEATFKYGDLLAHTYTGNTEYLYKATEAKCGVNETYYVYCSACKASSEDTDKEATFEKGGTALEHNWVDAQYNTDTLTHTFTCGRACGETMIANCEDSAVSFGYEPATCTEQGYDIVQCSACAHQWNINYTPALGHDYTQKIYDEAHLKEAANCKHENIYYYDCSRCDKNAKDIAEDEVYTGNVTFLNGEIRKHEFQNKVDAKYLADEATCFAAAKYYTSCKYEDCGKSSEEVNGEGKGVKFSSGSALTHKFDKQVETYLATKADCVNNATYYYVCSLCDTKGTTTWEKENSKSGHALTYEDAVAADCNNAGNYEYWYCATCNKYFKDEDATEAYANQNATVIAKLGHDKVSVAYKAATCEVDGNPTYEYCTRCGDTSYPAVLPDGYKAKGHNFTGAYTYDAVAGYHSRYCVNSYCDKVNVYDENGAIAGQVNVSGIVVDGVQVKYTVTYEDDMLVVTGGEKCEFTKYTASTVDGIHSHALECVCGNKSSIAYSDIDTFVKTVAPTCEADGYDAYACKDCKATWTKNVVAAAGHKWADALTSNGDGTHSICCTVEGCQAKKDTAKCSGGQATCADKAVCDACHTAYGETGTHVYNEENWEKNADAACGVNATEKNVCIACKTEYITREIANTALEHELGTPEVTKPATCKERGEATIKCTRENCNYTVTEPINSDPNEHGDGINYEEDAYEIAGNCATGVTHIYTCKICGKKDLVSVGSTHKYEEYGRVYGTCDAAGYVVVKCTQCNQKLTIDSTYPGFGGDVTIDNITVETENLVIIGHKYGEIVVTKESTCSTVGRGYKVCENCKTKVDVTPDDEGAEILKLKEHDLKLIKGYEATCTTSGRDDYYECHKCAYSQNANNEFATSAKGHSDSDADGKCDVCGVDLDSPASRCGCLCHKESGISQFFYKIAKFFWKLFGINKSCSCGNVHY